MQRVASVLSTTVPSKEKITTFPGSPTKFAETIRNYFLRSRVSKRGAIHPRSEGSSVKGRVFNLAYALGVPIDVFPKL